MLTVEQIVSTQKDQAAAFYARKEAMNASKGEP